MLLLASTSDKLRITTDAAGAVKCAFDFADYASGAVMPQRSQEASITTATTTDVVDPPAASTVRNIKSGSIFNDHASQAVLVTVDRQDGTTTTPVAKCTLLAGEALRLLEDGRWRHVDANGAEYEQAIAAATQAEMEAAASNEKAVTPFNQLHHPTQIKARATIAGAGTSILRSFGVSGITDTGAGQVTVTLSTAFATADWTCLYSTEFSSTTVIKGAHFTSMTTTAVLLQSVTEAGSAADPTNHHFVGIGDQ